MGIGSVLGGLVGLIPGVGPLVSGGAALLGGLVDQNKSNSSAQAATNSYNGTNRAEYLEERQYQYNLLQENRQYDRNYNYEIAAYNNRLAADAPRQAIASQLQGVMEGAKATGFNPLTLLGNTTSGGNAAFMGGSGGSASAAVARNTNAPPPLSSNEILTGALSNASDIISGDAERRRVGDTLRNDLAALQLEKLRSGVVAYGPSAATAVDGKPTPLGRRAATVLPTPSSGPTQLSYASGPVEVPRESVISEYIASNGEKLTFGVGPDPEEMLAGGALETAAEVKKRLRENYGVNTEQGSLPRTFDAGGWMLKTISPAFGFPFEAVTADRAKKASERADGIARYKKDKAAGKIPAPTYIKPYK